MDYIACFAKHLRVQANNSDSTEHLDNLITKTSLLHFIRCALTLYLQDKSTSRSVLFELTMLIISITYTQEAKVMEEVVNLKLVQLSSALLDDLATDATEKECYEDNAIWIISNVLGDEHLQRLDRKINHTKIAEQILSDTCFLSLLHRITINTSQLPTDLLCTVLLCLHNLLDHPTSLKKSNSLFLNVKFIVVGILSEKVNPETCSQTVIYFSLKLFNAALKVGLLDGDCEELMRMLERSETVRLIERAISSCSGVDKDDNEVMTLGFKVFGQLLSLENFEVESKVVEIFVPDLVNMIENNMFSN